LIKDSPHKVKLGDDYQYPIKGLGEASFKLDSEKLMKIKDVLLVPGLRKNLLYFSSVREGFQNSICRWRSSNVAKRKILQ
jgi:hypothetical protein